MGLRDEFAKVLSDNDMELHPNADQFLDELTERTANIFNKRLNTIVQELVFDVPTITKLSTAEEVKR